MPRKKRRLRTLLFLLAVITLAALSCLKEERKTTNPILPLEEGDRELDFIQAASRANLEEFIKKLQSPGDDEYDFGVKYPLKTDESSGFGREFVWLKDIVFENGRYSGALANELLYIEKYSLGDRIEFFMDDIADWMYYKGDYIEGGKSIKYLIEKIPPAERDEELRNTLARFR